MTKTALITGASGQDGRYLINLLSNHGYVIHAQSRQQRPEQDPNAQWHFGNLTNIEFLEALVAKIRPDEVYNLAALSRPIASWSSPRETAELNAFVPQHICELLLKHNPQCRFFQASSSEIFGDGFTQIQNEQTHCEPKSPYGVSKLFAHRIVGAYRQQYRLHACSGILFNHESPHRPLSFVSQKIAYAAAAISLGLSEAKALDERGNPILSDGKLRLGDLSVRRDFGYAGDYVEAMHSILQHQVPDDYVVGTGETHSILEFCDIAFRSIGLDWTDHVSVDPKLIRRVDSHYTRADSSKIRAAVGWRPKVSFEELVSMMVEAQVRSFKAGGAD